MAAVSFTANITEIITHLSNFNAETVVIKNASTTCTSSGQALLYTATISYSSASGDITGSTLVAQLVAWLLVQNSVTIASNDDVFEVHPVMNGAFAPQQVSSQAGPFSGVFLGGLSIGVLSAVFAAIAMYMYVTFTLYGNMNVQHVRYMYCMSFIREYCMLFIQVYCFPKLL